MIVIYQFIADAFYENFCFSVLLVLLGHIADGVTVDLIAGGMMFDFIFTIVLN